MSAPAPTTGTTDEASGRHEQADEVEQTLDVELVAYAGRHLGWGTVQALLGGLLAWRFGTVGLVLGGALVALGVLQLTRFARALRRAPGTLSLRDTEVLLPTALASGRTVAAPVGEIKNVYLLRRALGWSHAGPVLVVETASGTFEYPRDWFAGEHDQRRVCLALNRRLGRL